MEPESEEFDIGLRRDTLKRWGLVRIVSGLVAILGSAAMVVEAGTLVRSRWKKAVLFGGAILLTAYAFLATVGYVFARLLCPVWERQDRKTKKVRAIYGSHYQRVFSTLRDDLIDVDPFECMHGLRPGDKKYQWQYRYDVIEILDSIASNKPTLAGDLRSIIFRTLEANPYGNRRRTVGDEERYTAISDRLWDALKE